MELLFNFFGVAIVLLLLFYFSNESYILELLVDEIKNKNLVKIFIPALFIIVKYKEGPSA